MNKIVLSLLVLSLSPAAPAGSQQPDSAPRTPESHIVPLRKPSKLSMEKRFENVSGDPNQAGMPFVIRIHADAGYVIMPHRHPVDENIAVVEGTWLLGMGEHFKQQTLEPMRVGDYGLVPKGMAHFALSKTYTILQVHGIGPFTTTWLVPQYDLTARGALIKRSAVDPGQPATTIPDGCFPLRLGARMRGLGGEGIIVEAQCTPGELTQYRIEKPDGERFWAQRDALTAL